MASKDPTLTPGIMDKQIGKMVKAIDDTIENKLQSLAWLRTPGTWGRAREGLTPDNLLLDQGIRAFQKAQNAYSTGIQRFKQGAVGMLDENLKKGFLFGQKPVLETLVQEGNAAQLKAFLKAATPSGRSLGGITSAPASAFDDAAKAALNGDIKGANAILRGAGVSEDVIPKIPEFVANLKPTDPHFRDVTTQFATRMREFAKLSGTRANPLQVRNSVRDSLAREWLSQAERTSKRMGEFDGVAFQNKFELLGTEVQNTLFGKENANALRSLTRDYLMLGQGKAEISNAVAETLGSTASAIRGKAEGLVGGQPIKETIANLKNITRISQEQSEDALFQAVNKGRIQNADDLVEAVLKNPGNYDRLVARFGDDTLEDPLNLKDMVMSRIVNPAFPEGISSDAVASGSWGLPMRRALTQLNRNGSVSKILGQDTVNDLIKVSKLGERISDASLKSKTGLAPAAFAAGAGMRLMTAPISFMGEAATIFLAGRMMRSKPFLNFLLKPQYGGRKMYQKGIAAGADIGRANPIVLEMKDRINQQARLIAAAMAKPDSDFREEVGTTIRETIDQVEPTVDQVSEQISQVQVPGAPQQIAQAQTPGAPQQVAQLAPRGAEVLREIEQQKMLRGYA